MAATDAEIRAWAKDQGLEVPSRGSLPGHIRDAHEAYYGASNGDVPPGVSPPGDPDGVITDLPPERPPRNVRVNRTSRLGSWGKKTGRKRAKPKHARVPVTDLVSGIYSAVASFLTPLPATSRMMKFQAPVAGVVINDAVEGTIVDRALQPLARSAGRIEAVGVVVLPVLMVAALELRGPEAAPFILPTLRTIMLRYAKIAGPKMAEALASEAEFEETFGKTVDDVLAEMFATVGEGQTEDDHIRGMQETLATG